MDQISSQVVETLKLIYYVSSFFLTTISGDRNRLELNKYQTREDKK